MFVRFVVVKVARSILNISQLPVRSDENTRVPLKGWGVAVALGVELAVRVLVAVGVSVVVRLGVPLEESV